MNLDPYESDYLYTILEEFSRGYKELASLFNQLQIDPGRFPNEADHLIASLRTFHFLMLAFSEVVYKLTIEEDLQFDWPESKTFCWKAPGETEH